GRVRLPPPLRRTFRGPNVRSYQLPYPADADPARLAGIHGLHSRSRDGVRLHLHSGGTLRALDARLRYRDDHDQRARTSECNGVTTPTNWSHGNQRAGHYVAAELFAEAPFMGPMMAPSLRVQKPFARSSSRRELQPCPEGAVAATGSDLSRRSPQRQLTYRA